MTLVLEPSDLASEYQNQVSEVLNRKKKTKYGLVCLYGKDLLYINFWILTRPWWALWSRNLVLFTFGSLSLVRKEFVMKPIIQINFI